MSTAPAPSFHLHALDLPEILAHIGSFLSQRDALTCVLVSRAWLHAFQPVLWGHIETANDISPEDMERHSHFIRTLSLADLRGLERVLKRCERLETLILWPDAFEDEEDEEDEDEDEEEEESEGEGGVGGDGEEGEEGYWQGQDNDLAPTGATLGGEKGRRDSGVGDETMGLVKEQHYQGTLLSNTEAIEQQQQQQQRSRRQREEFQQGKFLEGTHSQLTNLLLRNRNLTRIEVYVERKSPGGSFWRALAAAPTLSGTARCPCPRLSSFQSLVNLQVYKHIKPFLQMCTRLESLDLERCSLRQLPAEYYTSLRFPRMEELRFGRIRDTSLQSQVLLMRQCPELRTLDWRVPRLGFPVEELCEAMRDGCWPRLHSLVLPESRLTDQELRRILWSTTNVTESANASMGTKENGRQYHHLYRQQQQQQQQQQQERGTNGSVLGGLMRFEARRSDFAGEAFMALKERGHFRTLRFLDLYQCPGLDSQMTIEILKECPLLESFDGNQLLARDILLSSGQRRQRWNRDERDEERGDKEDGGWVCTGMKYLDLHITGFANGMEDVRTHWQVFEQLAKLDKLVYLSIGGKCSANTSISNDNPRNATAENVGDGAVMSSMSSSSTPPPSISSIGPQTTAVATGASGGLDIRLRSGLGQLSTLKRLRMLRFTGVEQQMEVEDVEWMLENLPELKVVQGRLHTDPAKQQVLEKVLERGRVSAWSMYNNVQQAQQK